MRNTEYLINKARECQVTPIGNEQYRVISTSGSTYIIRYNDKVQHCECQWSQYKGSACSHILAVIEYLESLRGRKAYAHNGLEEAKRQRRPIVESDRHGLVVTSRKVESTPQFTWLLATTIKNHPVDGYPANITVYLRYTKGNGSWTIFNGYKGYPALTLTTNEAKQFIKIQRNKDGQALIAPDQAVVETNYRLSKGERVW